MDIPEHGRGYAKRGFEEHSDPRGDRFDDEEDWDVLDKRKYQSSRSYKNSNIDESEEWDSIGRRKSSGDGYGKQKLNNLSEVDSGDDDDYENKRSSRSKIPKKTQDDRIEKRSSSYYLEREVDNSRKSRAEESDKSLVKKGTVKLSTLEGGQGKSRSKSDVLGDGENDKNRDTKRSDKKDSTRETDHGTGEFERIPRRRWDEPDSIKKNEDRGRSDSHSGCKDPDTKSGRSHERSAQVKLESGEGQSKTDSEKGGRSSKREDRKLDNDRSIRGKLDAREEDGRNPVREGRSEDLKDDNYRRGREETDSGTLRPSSRSHVDKIDRQIPQRGSAHGTRDERESRERSDEDHGWLRDRSGRDVRRTSKRSRTPDRNDRRRAEPDEIDHTFSDSDNERSSSLRDKGYDNDSYREDRRKNRDTSSWNDRNRGWDGAKDGWKKRNLNRHDRELKAANSDFDYEKEWDMPKRERERLDYDKVHGRPNYRRDRGRTEGGHESSDTIEIKPNSFDYGREESGPGFSCKRPHSGMHAEYSSVNEEEWGYMHEDRPRMVDAYGPADDNQDRYPDDSFPLDQNGPNAGRNNYDMQGDKGRALKVPMHLNHSNGGQIVDNSGLQPPGGSGLGSSGGPFSKSGPQGGKGGGRPIRGGRGRATGRDTQRFGLPLPMMGPPFGPMGLPPGQLQPMGPNMSPAPGPPMGPGVFVHPFPAAQLLWPGARGVEMNMLAVPPGLPPLPSPGPAGPRFPPNMANGLNPAFFNQPGPGRGVSVGLSGSGFNAMVPAGRGMQHEKTQGGWVPPRIGPPGKAPSRGEQNDYSQNFVDTGMRPQNFIRELELTSTVEDYPKLRELIQKKDEIVANSATPPMYFKSDLREFILSPEFFGTKFDVILVDPPWEEYVHRAPGVSDHMEYWTFEEILNLKIEAIADTPSFIFLWVGDGVGLEQGRACLKKWGFRRCEDICWVKTNKSNATPGLRHDSHTLFQHSKEHCLMGIKGTVRRSTDGHIIHANIDTDIIIAEEPPYGSTTKPEDLYRIIEHFSLGRRRLELFGEDHNIRAGWLTVGKGLSSSNFNRESYVKHFADKDGKVWQGGGGRNPPQDAPHLVVTTPDIEGLRPKSPPAKNQQPLPQLPPQQSTSIQTTANSGPKRPAINSPQNMTPTGPHGLNQEASGSNPATPMPWASPMGGLKIALPEGNNMAPDDKFMDGFGLSSSFGQANMDHVDFDPQRTVNML